MRVLYLLITSLFILGCKDGVSEKNSTSIRSSNGSGDNIKYFLICTDPIAHSFHKDYSSSSKYCNGLKYCLHRGYDVIRLSEVEAKSKRSDPCDHCYGK